MAEILERSGYRVKIRVEVPAIEVTQTYSTLVADYTRRLRVPGFRPGKAPQRVVEARLDRAALMEEVKEKLLDASYPVAINELNLLPVGVQLLEATLEDGQAFVYVAEVETYPEVKLPDWHNFKVEVETPQIGDAEVEQAFQQLRERYGELGSVDRPIEVGDSVLIQTDDGAQFPVDMKNAQPHVVEALLGHTAGESVTVPVKDGEVVVREIPTKILEVKALRLPDLDEEFAKTLGEPSLEVLREKVVASLQAQASQSVHEAKIEQFTVQLAEGSEIEIPPSMQREEEQNLLRKISEDLQREKLSLQEYVDRLRAEGKLEDFQNDLRQSATTRLRRSLAREALAEQLGTEFSDEEWNEYLTHLARASRTSVANLLKDLDERTLVHLREQRKQEKALEEALRRIDL